MKFLAQLQNPPREFTAIPFWFLNGELTAEELRRQLADFAAHGIYGVVLHPRMGLSPDITYLGERYFAHIRTAVEAAAALDMKIVLYDEGMYPSGSASGLVVKDHPELASEGITLTQTVLPGDELLAQAENGALVVRKSGGTMRGLHWGEDDGEKNAPKTADILNPAAVSRFIELTHEAYYRELKEYFGATIIGFFTDEPSILGRNVSGMFPWTHGFAEIFRRAGGNAANLTALFDGRSAFSIFPKAISLPARSRTARFGYTGTATPPCWGTRRCSRTLRIRRSRRSSRTAAATRRSPCCAAPLLIRKGAPAGCWSTRATPPSRPD